MACVKEARYQAMEAISVRMADDAEEAGGPADEGLGLASPTRREVSRLSLVCACGFPYGPEVRIRLAYPDKPGQASLGERVELV